MAAASLPNPPRRFSLSSVATATAEDPPLVITSFPSPLLPRSSMTATATATAIAEDPPLVITSLPNPLLPRSSMATAEDPPLVITDKDAMRAWSRHQRYHGKTIALVPTMGYLHAGHLSLVAAARSHADLTVVSIYVNPAQFAPSEDLATYPSDLPADLRKLAAAPGVAAVFCPSSLYNTGATPCGEADGASCMEVGGEGHETWVTVERLEKGLCGESRPVLFRGVATVVTKLFNIVEPDVAVFGKDYQQWRVISRMEVICLLRRSPFPLMSPLPNLCLPLRHLARRHLPSLAVAIRYDTATWTPAPLTRITPTSADESLFHVAVDISESPDLTASYTAAGQYLQLRVASGDAKSTFLAIASPPFVTADHGVFKFLVKRVSGFTAESLCGLRGGDMVEIGAVMGRGFEVDRIWPPEKFSTVIIFATISGIS